MNRLMPSPDTFARGVFVDVCEMDMAGRAAVWQRTTQVVTNFTPAARLATPTPSPTHGARFLTRPTAIPL
ncbi:hypothetical protein KC348_g46 [Hortaea werneckii]|nr:hypothetical protein KC348_g46 [Hortaea werneckii]